MALKAKLLRLLPLLCATTALVLAYEAWEFHRASRFNQALEDNNMAAVTAYGGDFALFAQAYVAQQAGEYQQARVLYSQLERADNASLRAAALFNSANTYLQQADEIDLSAEADRGAPLIELAKVGYRQVLARDAAHWGAKYNLERALQLLPDAREQALMDLKGLRGGVRAVVSPDTDMNLP